MKLIANLTSKLFFFTLLVLGTVSLHANTIAWKGGTVGSADTLTVSNNWVPATTPTAGDTGTFDSSAVNFNPKVSSGNTFNIDLVKTTAGPYNFFVDGLGTSFTLAGTGAGPDFGFQNNSGVLQNFHINNQGTLNFQNSCSADSSSGTTPGLVTYLVGDGSTAATMNFKNASTASTAAIQINAGASVNFLDNSSAGTSNVTIADTGTMNLAQTTNGEFQATLSGIGTVNKIGSAITNIVSDNSGFAGKTNVNAGKLAINNILGGNVVANINSTVAGTGTIGGNLNANSGSIVAPGNSIGTLTVAGNYTQMPNSTLQVEVDGSGNASKVAVGGQASINMGSIVNVVPTLAQLTPNTSFTAPILTSNTGVSGTFSTVTSSNPLISVSVMNDPNDVFLTWTNTFSLIGRTSNQRDITAQLQTLVDPTPDEFAVLSALALLPERRQQHALQQLSAQPYANMLLIAEIADHKFIQRLYNPLRPLITSHPCCVADCCDLHRCNFDTWFDGGWTHSHMKGNRNAQGYDIKGYEVSLGTHVTVDNCWTIGLAGSYERDHLRYHLGGKGKSNTYLGAIYTLYRPADFYFLGDVVLGCTQNRIKRHIDIGTFHFKARARPNVFQGTGYLEVGRDFALDCFLFQPFLGVEGGYYRHDHINEHRSSTIFAVNVKDKTYGTASSRLGVHLLTELSCLKFYVDAAWQYRLTSPHNSSRQHFRDFGDSFTIIGIPVARNSLDAAITLAATVVEGWEIYAEAQGQFWKNASSYSVLGGMVIGW